MLREVPLPPGVTGALFLAAMPGRPGYWESLDAAIAAMRAARVTVVLALTPLDEMARRAPAYATALGMKTLPWETVHFPIEDFAAPDDREAFAGTVRAVAARLRAGDRIAVHCGAGIGRTGLMATAILAALGQNIHEARALVSARGSGAETPEQADLIRWLAAREEQRTNQGP
jgi:hypothetical protein